MILLRSFAVLAIAGTLMAVANASLVDTKPELKWGRHAGQLPLGNGFADGIYVIVRRGEARLWAGPIPINTPASPYAEVQRLFNEAYQVYPDLRGEALLRLEGGDWALLPRSVFVNLIGEDRMYPENGSGGAYAG